MASSEDELREELLGGEIPQNRRERAPRIVEPDRGGETDVEKDMVGELVEDEDSSMSAEEAAIHIEEAP
jgi:uncharacterized protein DUF5709